MNMAVLKTYDKKITWLNFELNTKYCIHKHFTPGFT